MPGLHDHKLDQPPKLGGASFGAGRYTAEHIFNCRVMIDKHLEHQKAFNRVSHDDLWKVLLGGNIDGGFVLVIRTLCDHLSSELF